MSFAGFARFDPRNLPPHKSITSFLPQPEPLSVADDHTLECWCQTPEWDTRSLEEFARDGGRPLAPPNRFTR